MTALLLLCSLLVIVSAVTCYQIAKKRGRRPVFWGVMGALFGPLAIPFAFLLHHKRQKNNVST